MSTMPIPFLITRDVQGYPSSGTQTAHAPSKFTQTVKLTADTPEAITVPLTPNYKLVAYFRFSYGDNVFFSPQSAPTLDYPTGTVTLDISELLLNGMGLTLTGGQEIQLLSPSAAYVTIVYYATYYS